MRVVSSQQVADVLAALPGEPRAVVSGNFATPHVLVSALDGALPRYRLFALNAQTGLPVRPEVVLETCFVGPGMRRAPTLRYVPARLSLAPLLFRDSLPPDVVLLHTSQPHQGTVSLGIEVNILPAAIEAVRRRGGLVIAQANAQMPYTFGDGVLSLDDIDYVVEVDEALPGPGEVVLDDESRAIGERVADLVNDGSTVQMGIGAIPDAALHGMLRKRGLRIWSEMFSDGVLRLDEVGALDSEAPLVASFLFGSPQLYAWVHRNSRVRVQRTEKTNDPSVIAHNPQVVSINSALQVDLFGQANASRINARIHSGFGGQTDFIVGALHSPGGQAILALRSWHPKADVSTVVPLVEEPVTSFQPSAVVTEHGVARLWGTSQVEQAAAMIEQVAHPRVREELWEEARVLGLAQ